MKKRRKEEDKKKKSVGRNPGRPKKFNLKNSLLDRASATAPEKVPGFSAMRLQSTLTHGGFHLSLEIVFHVY